MLRWALIFLVVALVAALFGFGGIAGVAADIARFLFFLFLILFVVALIFGRARGPVVYAHADGHEPKPFCGRPCA